jgi:hypothetical protein
LNRCAGSTFIKNRVERGSDIWAIVDRDVCKRIMSRDVTVNKVVLYAAAVDRIQRELAQIDLFLNVPTKHLASQTPELFT